VKDPVALETAIEGFRRYLDHGSKRRKDRANTNYLLGRSFRFRALSDKSLDQFEEAADHLECAVAEADFTNAAICPYLSNLGFCYFERYQVSNEVVDLDRALAALARSLAASEDVEEAPQRIANLANILSLWIERAGYEFETLNLFALLEARLVEAQRSETAAYFGLAGLLEGLQCHPTGLLPVRDRYVRASGRVDP
jgi:tetratricopeptide (TPR) repeat protein